MLNTKLTPLTMAGLLARSQYLIRRELKLQQVPQHWTPQRKMKSLHLLCYELQPSGLLITGPLLNCSGKGLVKPGPQKLFFVSLFLSLSLRKGTKGSCKRMLGWMNLQSDPVWYLLVSPILQVVMSRRHILMTLDGGILKKAINTCNKVTQVGHTWKKQTKILRGEYILYFFPAPPECYNLTQIYSVTNKILCQEKIYHKMEGKGCHFKYTCCFSSDSLSCYC